ncbi:hypothetical protein T439DRAFT_326343, partial [Meredithblackwellia eburnea MCA 4105]
MYRNESIDRQNNLNFVQNGNGTGLEMNGVESSTELGLTGGQRRSLTSRLSCVPEDVSDIPSYAWSWRKGRGLEEMDWKSHWAVGVRKRVLHFSPAWFASNMGLGITSMLLYRLPYQFRGLHTIAALFFALNVVLFIVFLLMSLARYTIWPRCWTLMLAHPVQSMFLGVFSMGFGTIGDGVTLFLAPHGHSFLMLAWACWWIEAFISVAVGIGVPFIMFSKQKHSGPLMTGVWLLPVVSPNVAAAAGGIVAQSLSPSQARLTIAISYILLGTSLPPAVLVMALYFNRLALHHGPPSSVAISVFLPIGPCGQSAYAFLQLSSVLRELQTSTGHGITGSGHYGTTENEMMTAAIYAGSIVVALFLVGFGAFWMVLAYASVLQRWRRKRLYFNLGWWAFTFPVGTMASATTLLGTELDSTTFKVTGTVLSLVVTFFCLLVGVKTALEAWKGDIFSCPELGPLGLAPTSTTSLYEDSDLEDSDEE